MKGRRHEHADRFRVADDALAVNLKDDRFARQPGHPPPILEVIVSRLLRIALVKLQLLDDERIEVLVALIGVRRARDHVVPLKGQFGRDGDFLGFGAGGRARRAHMQHERFADEFPQPLGDFRPTALDRREFLRIVGIGRLDGRGAGSEIEGARGRRRTVVENRHGVLALESLRQQHQFRGRADADHRRRIVLVAARRQRSLEIAAGLADFLGGKRELFAFGGQTHIQFQVVEKWIQDECRRERQTHRLADFRHARPRLHAFLPRLPARFDEADVHRRPFDAVEAIHEDEREACEQDVHEHAGRDDEHPLADTLVLERPWVIVVAFQFGALADHADVAAQWNESNFVERFSVAETTAGQRRTEAEAERLHVNVAPLGRQEMAEFVNENDEAQADDDEKALPEAGPAEFVDDESDDGDDDGDVETIQFEPL